MTSDNVDDNMSPEFAIGISEVYDAKNSYLCSEEYALLQDDGILHDDEQDGIKICSEIEMGDVVSIELDLSASNNKCDSLNCHVSFGVNDHS